MIPPDSLNAHADCLLVRLCEPILLCGVNCMLFQATIIPAGNPCLLVSIEKNASHSAAALVRLRPTELSGQLQLPVEDNGPRPSLFDFPPLSGRERLEYLHAMAVPHDHPPSHPVVPDHMLSAVLIHRH